MFDKAELYKLFDCVVCKREEYRRIGHDDEALNKVYKKLKNLIVIQSVIESMVAEDKMIN